MKLRRLSAVSILLLAPGLAGAAAPRDPFRAPEERPPEAAKPCRQGSTCQFSLEQLALVGTVTSTSTPIAMVRDPEGVGHVVRRGSHLGKERARVVSVRGDLIEAVYLIEVQGKRVEQKVTLAMAKDARPEAIDLSKLEE